MSKEDKLYYLKQKRDEVLDELKPICEVFDIEYDYVIDENSLSETLVLNNQKIGCSSNSISAIVEELGGLDGYRFGKVKFR